FTRRKAASKTESPASTPSCFATSRAVPTSDGVTVASEVASSKARSSFSAAWTMVRISPESSPSISTDEHLLLSPCVVGLGIVGPVVGAAALGAPKRGFEHERGEHGHAPPFAFVAVPDRAAWGPPTHGGQSGGHARFVADNPGALPHGPLHVRLRRGDAPRDARRDRLSRWRG